jgi:hypothetical protein
MSAISNNIMDAYNNSNIGFVSSRDAPVSEAVSEIVTYYDPTIYSREHTWESSPNQSHSTQEIFRNNRSKKGGAKSSYVFTGFMDCRCGKRIEAVCERRFKLARKLHFKANPECKKGWDELK